MQNTKQPSKMEMDKWIYSPVKARANRITHPEDQGYEMMIWHVNNELSWNYDDDSVILMWTVWLIIGSVCQNAGLCAIYNDLIELCCLGIQWILFILLLFFKNLYLVFDIPDDLIELCWGESKPSERQRCPQGRRFFVQSFQRNVRTFNLLTPITS